MRNGIYSDRVGFKRNKATTVHTLQGKQFLMDSSGAQVAVPSVGHVLTGVAASFGYYKGQCSTTQPQD